MTLLAQYRAARSAEATARLRRVLALRAMVATGTPQRQVATALGITQPAVSQQLHPKLLAQVDPQALIEAASPVLRQAAEDRGFTDLAVFGSVARGEARPDSDIDLLVRPPAGTTIRQLQCLRDLFAGILGRPVDLVTYGGLRPGLDDDVRRETVMLS